MQLFKRKLLYFFYPATLIYVLTVHELDNLPKIIVIKHHKQLKYPKQLFIICTLKRTTKHTSPRRQNYLVNIHMQSIKLKKRIKYTRVVITMMCCCIATK